ncbi:P-loop containing nucleoside triphosphate hydrolase protein [Suillus subaureus]|uniref:P-loop containing nucleoside triphosphate hydrolase protein n=1 Tax=Suillus subaureus TaxID=48587 RepID=A0A9P7JCG5_9AGAM|nr:P-loop containing nucleoside triphosphate hydrolase protein [Suillus subaureus]KAG1814414.1 P-loop containing nucleoside triphosphate hydrolase protein [Suillus subaureus]
MQVIDPRDTRRFKHTRIGVWDVYEERRAKYYIPGSSIRETYGKIIESIPYVVQMLRDVLSIRRSWLLLSAFFVVEVLSSLVPAISIWYSGQLLRLVETAMETRTVNTTALIHVAVGHLTCQVTTRLLHYARNTIVIPMNISIKRFYAERVLHEVVRLDLPTYEDSNISRQFASALSSSGSSIAWKAIQASTSSAMTVISVVFQLSILFTILWEQQDGFLLIVLGSSRSIFQWYSTQKSMARPSVWGANTTNKDYIRMRGLKGLCDALSHRKELVAGNLGEYITEQYHELAQSIGDDAGDFFDLHKLHFMKKHLGFMSILNGVMHELPQIILILRVIQKPMTLPLALASLYLIDRTSSSLIFENFSPYQSGTLVAQLADVRALYEVKNVQNKVVDGRESFPENMQSLKSGIPVEFRNVSFRYPGAEKYALRDVSFKIGAGQLCVIVGTNGSGKSTILKLVSRIYDPTEGTILIDDRDIKTLKLADLRNAMSILFQDYTHFPLSIHENIALGNPTLANDGDKVREAARLASAEEFIDDLPGGFNTYIKRVDEGHIMDPITHGDFIDPPSTHSTGDHHVTISGLSGGQMQRLAVSRTFMRSFISGSDSSVGMMLFDEPSAALDPKAEYDLFDTLREWRGEKTLIFSTHRFGNLTRHADLILYLDESVQEEGTHDELMMKGGSYATNWNLQARPYM